MNAFRQSSSDDDVSLERVQYGSSLAPRRRSFLQAALGGVAAVIRIFIVIALCAGMTMSSGLAAPPEDYIGFWYGEGFQPSARKSLQWIMQRKADGSFVVDFREYVNCRVAASQVENGTWKANAEGWETETLALNGRPLARPFHDDYIVESIADGKIRYRHLQSGETWTTRKVDPTFEMPACQAQLRWRVRQPSLS